MNHEDEFLTLRIFNHRKRTDQGTGEILDREQFTTLMTHRLSLFFIP
ncbi:hypothetical protein [Clostridium botulinum]|nr:hypothetical protein [Clostridium botulinum]